MTLNIRSTVRLANGVEMPLLGLGTYKTTDSVEIEKSVGAALEIGYRAIDTASLYDNEEGIGRAIAASGVERSDLFLASKVWNDEQGYQGTLDACERSMLRLGVDQLDLYLVHWPQPNRMADTWRAMEELLASGRVRAIGVCNHFVEHLEMLARTARVAPMVDQFEHHPWLQQPELIDYCRAHDIVVEAWGPVMRGRLGEEPALTAIAADYGRTPAQIVLRWIVQRGIVAIPKSVHPERVRENAGIFGFELTEQTMTEIALLDRGERLGPHPDRWLD